MADTPSLADALRASLVAARAETVARYRGPDTSDKREDESWLEYWDRKADERHGADCQCSHHRLRALGIGDDVDLVRRAVSNASS